MLMYGTLEKPSRAGLCLKSCTVSARYIFEKHAQKLRQTWKAAGAVLGRSSKKRIIRIIHYGRKRYNKQMRARIIEFNQKPSRNSAIGVKWGETEAKYGCKQHREWFRICTWLADNFDTRSSDKFKYGSISNSVTIVTLVDKLEANIQAFREEQDSELPGPAMLWVFLTSGSLAQLNMMASDP